MNLTMIYLLEIVHQHQKLMMNMLIVKLLIILLFSMIQNLIRL